MTDLRLIDIVEMDFERCGLVYGAAPCEAELGVTGERKCYNTLKTCQDRPNFDAEGPTLATWRFARPTDYFPASGIEDAIPSVESVRFTPGNIGMGEGLGQRPSLVVTFRDHRWGDTGPNGDPYLAERGFDPYRRGTFWGKWRSRQPYMRGRAIRWRQGLLGQTLDQFQTRHFIIDKFDGPSADGLYTVTARDAMQFLSSDRSQCPRPSRGNLAAPITASSTSASLVPAGIGNAEYPADGWLNISGTEIVGFSRTGDTLNLTGGRGLWGTTAQDHDAEARVQVCADFIADDPAYALWRLMTEFGDVPASVINLDDWEAETDAFYDGGLLTTLIAEPTATEKLATDLVRESGLSTWWDDKAARQRLQVIRNIDTDAMALNASYAPGEGNTIAGSLTITEQPDKRKSRAVCWYGQVTPLDGIDKKNLPLLAYRVAGDQEVAEGSPEIDTIYSRWIQAGGLVAAAAVTARRLSRYVVAPRRFTVNIPRWGSLQPELGQGVLLTIDAHQDDEGNPETVPCQIIGIDPGASGGAEYALTLEELRIDPEFAPEFAPNTVIITANSLNVNFYERLTQSNPPPVDGDTCTLIVNESVEIGSASASLPSLDIGTGWASGVTIVVDIRANATVAGRGGDGARGRANQDNTTGYSGESGGLAFRTTVPILLKGPGRILAGGGGGGGGGSDYAGWTGPQRNGGGGGGGAGSPPGAGGAGAGGSQPGQPGTLTTGGAGGNGTNGSSSEPHRGGAGGAPGANGSNATAYRGGSGGSGGTAIDGWSHVDDTDWTGTITGPTIN